MPAIVGIDASRYAIAQRTGTETYSFELLNAMVGQAPQDWMIRLYSNRLHADAAGLLARLGSVRSIPFRRFWTHGRLSAELALHRPDVLFVPSHVVPLVHPRSVVTIHDLGYLYEPDAHPQSQRRMLDLTTRWNARVAHRIIAISETTRIDLIERYGVPAERIKVVHHGVSSRFAPSSVADQITIRARLQLPDRFVLAVGTIQPRKNLGVLARAVAQLRTDEPDVCLVVAGRTGWMAESVLNEINTALPKNAYKLLNYVDEVDLPGLYGSAVAVAMVSRYEGFGLPVLEALACGANVVISGTPALVEIAGGAATVTPVGDVAEIAEALKHALAESSRTNQAGIERAEQFTWDRCARETMGVLDECLSPEERSY